MLEIAFCVGHRFPCEKIRSMTLSKDLCAKVKMSVARINDVNYQGRKVKMRDTDDFWGGRE